MNKQEGIKELESLKMTGKDARAACYNEAINVGITIMKKLDEPQQPVVKPFVAEWFERNKTDLEPSLFNVLIRIYKNGANNDFEE